MLRLPAPTDTPELADIARRLELLTTDHARRWGRMTAAQMTRHCRTFVELCLGRVRTGLAVRLLARALGPWFLRRMLRRSPQLAPKNLGTLPVLRTGDADGLDLDEERASLLRTFEELRAAPDPLRHPLYGTMRRDDVIGLVRHHTAHHLNQFGLLDDGRTATLPA